MNEVSKDLFDSEPRFDFQEIDTIIQEMDSLRRRAKKTGHEEIYVLMNSAFNMCFTSYYLGLRMQELPPAT